MNEQAKRNQQLGYYLHKTVFLLDKVADRALRKNAKIGLSQFLILLAADMQSDLSLSQQEIADYLGIDKAAISRHLNALVQRQLVWREVSSASRQTNTIAITESGVQLLRQAQTVMQQTMTPYYNAASNNSEALLQALRAIHDSLAAA